MTDQSTARPLAGAHLILNNAAHAATGPNGYFAFPPLAAGSYDVACFAAGYDPVILTADVVVGLATTLNFALTAGSSTTTSTPAPGNIDGVVVDASTTSPVANATVTLSPGRVVATTDGQGRFSFTAVPAGGHLLQVSAAGYVRYRQPVPLLPGATLTINVTLVPKPASTTVTGTLVLTVTDQSTSQPLPTAVCFVDDQGPFFVDPATGGVTINNVPVGRHVILVEALQFQGTVVLADVTANQTTSQSVALTPQSASASASSDTNISSRR